MRSLRHFESYWPVEAMKSEEKQCCKGVLQFLHQIGSMSTFIGAKDEFDAHIARHLCGYHGQVVRDFRRGKFLPHCPQRNVYRFLYYLHSHSYLQRCSLGVIKRAAAHEFGIGDTVFEEKIEPILQRNKAKIYHRCLRQTSFTTKFKGN